MIFLEPWVYILLIVSDEGFIVQDTMQTNAHYIYIYTLFNTPNSFSYSFLIHGLWGVFCTIFSTLTNRFRMKDIHHINSFFHTPVHIMYSGDNFSD